MKAVVLENLRTLFLYNLGNLYGGKMKREMDDFMTSRKRNHIFVFLYAGIFLIIAFIVGKANTKEGKSDVMPTITDDQAYQSEGDYYRVISDSDNKEQLYVRYSKDQGKSWSSYPLPICSDLSNYEFYFLDSDEGYLMIYGSTGAGQVNKALYHTIDGGATWTLQSGTSQPDDTVGIMYYSHLSGIGYGKNGLVIASEMYRGTGIDDDPVVTWSHDYGVTWEELAIEIPREQMIETYGLTFTEEQIHGEGLDAYINGSEISIPIKIMVSNQAYYANYISEDGGDNWRFEFVK